MNKLKRLVFDGCIATGEKVSILVNTKQPGSILPENIRIVEILKPHKLSILEYGLNLPRPIYDLKSAVDGIHGTLEFGGALILTFVPWEAIIQIQIDISGKVFLASWDMPTIPAAEQTTEEATKRERPVLKAV